MKALALLSGGLDSTLALKMILEQGVSVEAINFVTPFCLCRKGGCGAAEAAKALNVPMKVFSVGTDYLRVVRKPKFGYGKNINPCVDCRIFMLKKAKRYAKEIGAKFIFTGEVLGQRPMSQHGHVLGIIEREAGLEGQIVRPLSAKLLPKTEAERMGLIDSGKLGDIEGRSRKKQIELAKEYNIAKYPCPAGGCLLTEKEFAKRLRDLFRNKNRVSLRDVNFLKVGRHFRFGKSKIVVGRNEAENGILQRTKQVNDYYFEVPDSGSPTTVLQGPKTKKAIQKAAELTAFYSDKKCEKVQVNFGKVSLSNQITVTLPSRTQVEQLRLF